MKKYILLFILLIIYHPFYGHNLNVVLIDSNKNNGTEYIIVKINNIQDSSIHKGAITDKDGMCKFVDIPTGIYNLKTFDIIYKNSISENIHIFSDITIKIFIEKKDSCLYDEKKNKICPICHKINKVIPIVYGLVIRKTKSKKPINNKKSKVFYAGCNITICDPNWYCKRDKFKF